MISAATRSPERTAPSMKPNQAFAVSVPAQWMGPVDSRSAGPLSLRILPTDAPGKS